MKNSFQLIFSLTLICLISGSLLAFVYSATADRIAAVKIKQTEDAAAKVLPPHAKIETTREIVHDGITYLFRPATKEDGSLAGFAIQFASNAGYGGKISMMLGIDTNGQTTGLQILPGHQETPGLGAKITEKDFRDRYAGKSLTETTWKVRKDGGQIDEITAATISSRAVTDAVGAAAKAFEANRSSLMERE